MAQSAHRDADAEALAAALAESMQCVAGALNTSL